MVKLATTVIFTAALAVATVRAQEAGAETVEEVLSRDVSDTESDLFGRAAAKVMNDLFSREELAEAYGREFESDITWRDVLELTEREAGVMAEAEELAARAAAPQQPPAPAATPAPDNNGPHTSVFGQVLNFFNGLIHPKKAAPAANKSKPAPAAAKADKPKKEEAAPPKEEAKGEAAEEGAEEARDLLDGIEEPVERSLTDEEALEVRELLEQAELELAEREFDDEALMEARELLEEYSDVIERDFEEDVFEREFDEEELLEREFEEDVFEREFGDEWDDELLSRAFDIVEELEQLD